MQQPIPENTRRQGAAGVRDVFVVAAMSVVALALGLGLHMQLETGALLAALMALSLYAGLVASHILVRRAQAVLDLKAEIARLNLQLAEVKRGGRHADVATQPAGPPPPLAPRLPVSGDPLTPFDPTAETVMQPTGAMLSMRGYPSLPRAQPVRPTGPASQPPPPPMPAGAHRAPAQPPTPPTREQPPAPMPAGAAPAQPPPSSRPPDVARPKGAEPPPLPSSTVPPQTPTMATPSAWTLRPGMQREAAFAAMPAPAKGGDSRMSGPPPAAHPGAAPSETQAKASRAPEPARASSGSPVEHALPAKHEPPSAASAGAQPAEQKPAAATLPGPASVAASSPPATSAAPDGDREGKEFATMQLLIQQLAAQLNAPALPPAQTAGPVPAADVDPIDAPDGASGAEPTGAAAPSDSAAAIARSVTVLRAAADEMRRREPIAHAPAAASSPPTDLRPSATDRPFAVQQTAAALSPPSPYGRLALIAEAVTAGRVDVYLDPILALDQRKARHFEVSVRLRTPDDVEIDADEYRAVAAETGLLAQIDQAKLSRTMAVAERLRARGSGGSLFSTLAGESLADDAFLESFADTFANEEVLGSRLVLAFTQRDVRAFGDVHWEALTTMAEIGLRFSLEDVADLDMDFEKLAEYGFAFVKLDAAVFLGGLPTPGGPIPASDLCLHLSGLGLALVVGHITDERDLARIVGFGVLFGQGALFGAPRPVMVEAAPAKAAA